MDSNVVSTMITLSSITFVNWLCFVALLAYLINGSQLGYRIRDTRYLRKHPEATFRQTNVYIWSRYRSSPGSVTMDSDTLAIRISLDLLRLGRKIPLRSIRKVKLRDAGFWISRVDISFADDRGNRRQYLLGIRNPAEFLAIINRLRAS
jgi:hypothetical protein